MGDYNPLGRNALLEVQKPGTSIWVEVPGVAELNMSGGDAATATFVSLRRGQTQQAGRAGAPSVSSTLAYAPHTEVGQLLISAHQKATVLRFRFTTEPSTILTVTGSNNTFAIDTDGVLSFAGDPDLLEDPDSLLPGYVIRPTTQKVVYYIIETNDQANPAVVTVAPAPGTAVAATPEYTIDSPGVREQFSGQITLVKRPSFSDSGVTTTPFNLTLTGSSWSTTIIL